MTRRALLLPLAEATVEEAGGKAAGLARLGAAGLPVPPGLVLPVELYRQALPAALPELDAPLVSVEERCAALLAHLESWRPSPALEAELAGALATLGAPLAVRSSATCEDLAGRSAAGVFETVLGVATLEALVAAVGVCYASLWRLPAWATLRARGRAPSDEAMAVLLQRELVARAGGLSLSIDPGDEERVRVEGIGGPPGPLARGGADPHVARLRRHGTAELAAPGFPLPEARLHELRRLTLAAEELLGQAVELEWIFDGERLWIVQARAVARARRRESFPVHFHQAIEGVLLWRWDREHNPDPLSPAHAGLIALLEERREGAPRLAVHGGYLYEAVADPDLRTSDAEERDEESWRALGSRLAAFEAEVPLLDPTAQLERAVEFFRAFHRDYGEGISVTRRARVAALRRFLRHELGRDDAELFAALNVAEEHAALRRAQELYELASFAHQDAGLSAWLTGQSAVVPPPVLDHLARYGTVAPSWDVACPTVAEVPESLRPTLTGLAAAPCSPAEAHARQLARADALVGELARDLSSEQAQRLRRLVSSARKARARSEDDDLLFARALFAVRSALLGVGRRFAARGGLLQVDDVFYLPLERVLAVRTAVASDDELARLAQTGRAKWEQARLRVPPLTIQGDRLTYAPAPSGRVVLQGVGIGEVVRGRVRRVAEIRALLDTDLSGTVLVCPTLLPALATVLPQVLALVTDHGGLLSHAACLARELGVTAVVGTGSATSLLSDGELVWVDGRAGRVVRLGEGS